MVEGGKITFRVEMDASQFNNMVKQAGVNLQTLKGKVDGVSPSIEKLGENTTTTAVRFQTLTQGAINLTTAFTQTYTSISNLQRAKTSLQASAVGVERALDLQKRKQFQLNEEMKKAAPNYDKIRLLTGELATAHDDLAVKQQRVKDQTDAVNDTYILFALNIANVGFSAIQTSLSMVKMAQEMKKAGAAGSLLTATMGKYLLVATAVIISWEILVGQLKIFGEQAAKDYTIQGNLNKMFSAGAITLDNYHDKINDVNTSQSRLNDTFNGTKKSLDSLNPSMGEQIKLLNQLITEANSPEAKRALGNVGRMIGGGTSGFR